MVYTTYDYMHKIEYVAKKSHQTPSVEIRTPSVEIRIDPTSGNMVVIRRSTPSVEIGKDPDDGKSRSILEPAQTLL